MRAFPVRNDIAMTPPSLTRFAWLSIAAALITLSLKMVAYALTGSVGLLSDALESLVNLAAAIMALAMLHVAAQPPDDDHAYGHTKAEYFSSALEGLLILVAAAGIAWTALPRLFDPQPIEQVGLGMAGRVGNLPRAFALAALQDSQVLLRNRDDFSPEHVEMLPEDLARAGDQAGRVGYVGSSALVNPYFGVGVALDQPAGTAGMVEMDVRQEDRPGRAAVQGFHHFVHRLLASRINDHVVDYVGTHGLGKAQVHEVDGEGSGGGQVEYPASGKVRLRILSDRI